MPSYKMVTFMWISPVGVLQRSLPHGYHGYSPECQKFSMVACIDGHLHDFRAVRSQWHNQGVDTYVRTIGCPEAQPHSTTHPTSRPRSHARTKQSQFPGRTHTSHLRWSSSSSSPSSSSSSPSSSSWSESSSTSSCRGVLLSFRAVLWLTPPILWSPSGWLFRMQDLVYTQYISTVQNFHS